ncbi:MAG: lipocalin-like domain-containing protein [Gammaproteobacteria bacterium]
MQKRSLLAITTLLILGAVILTLRWPGDGVDPLPRPPLERAFEGLDTLARQFPPPGDERLAWPRDHGAKPEQFAESWLFAGLVHDEGGAAYGFQLAFDRVALQAQPPERGSNWAARDIYRARFAIEPAGARVRSGERVSRAALGLAGAEAEPARAWLEDWEFTLDERAGGFLLRAGDAGAGMVLRLTMPGTAPTGVETEIYRGYWWPGLRAEGTLDIDGQSRAVSGHAMLDRLWGRGLPVGRGQLALARSWFDLGGGAALRCEHWRRRAGGGAPLTECLGHAVRNIEAIRLEPEDQGWRTLAGVRYPLGWRLELGAGSQPREFLPLSPEKPASISGSWSGILVEAGDDARWALLELSNFAAP